MPEGTLMGLEQLLQTNRQEILTIAAKHGAYNVRIFGSVARGEADEKATWISWWMPAPGAHLVSPPD